MSGVVNLKIHRTEEIFKFTAGSGTASKNFNVQEGARLIFSLIVRNLSGGGSVDVVVENSGTGEDGDWLTVLSMTSNANGIQQRIYADFHPIFRVTYVVTGTADVKFITTVRDNSSSTFIENANLLVDIDHTKGDSVQVGDGVDVMQVNDDGSINVQLIENANARHYAFPDNTIDPDSDGYGYKEIATYAMIDSLTRMKKIYVHSEGLAEVRVMIDSVEFRVKSVDPLTSTAEIELMSPYALDIGQIFSIEARIAPEIKREVAFRSIALEAYKAS